MEIHIGNRVADVTVVSKEDNKVRLNVDGRIYDVDIAMAENGSCSILHDGNSYNTEVIRGEGGKSYDVNLFYRSYHVDIADTQVKYLRMRKGGEERQDDKIIAPMPGKVMKMQSNYKVNSDCVVREILVAEGDSVSSNQILMTLDIINEE